MHIRAAESEGTDGSAARLLAARKRNQPIGDLERTVGEIDPGIGLLEVQRRRNFFVMEHQCGLNQARNTGRVRWMSDIAFDGADVTKLLPGSFGLKNF